MKPLINPDPAVSGEAEMISALEELSSVSWRMAARLRWAKTIKDAQTEHKKRKATATRNGIKNY